MSSAQIAAAARSDESQVRKVIHAFARLFSPIL
jgi:hypothetical protein